ncbi:MAG: hypothetical protein AAGK26_08755, partial [Pseudomonadota bacterium]
GQFAGVAIPDQDDVAEPNASANRPIQLTDEQLLSIAFRAADDPPVFDDASDTATDAPDRPSDALRLSSWCLTGVVASMSTPIALSMAAVNLIRGEDFRLNTQVLVFTMAIVALNASNAFADVAQALGM